VSDKKEKTCKIKANDFTPNTEEEDIGLTTHERNRREKHTDPKTSPKSIKNEVKV
jgi:hypothetical protein